MKLREKLLGIAAICLATMFAPAALGSPLYSVVDLGIGGAYGINNSGQVAVNTASHAFRYSGGTMTDLGSLGGTSTQATGINDAGDIVGYYFTPGFFDSRAFLYSGGIMADLSPLLSAGSYARGINNSGQVVGFAGLSDNHAFLYSGGIISDLGSGTGSSAHGINGAGQVVGLNNNHAFLYSGGIMTDLGTLGGPYSDATGINSFGQVIGNAGVPSGETHAFLYSGGLMIDLGNLSGSTGSIAYGINSAGQVVGGTFGPAVGGAVNPYHAFLYTGGIMLDINDLVSLGTVLTGAQGINDSGQIIANGENGHAYLLTPLASSVPEPGSFVLLGTGLTALALVAARRRKIS